MFLKSKNLLLWKLFLGIVILKTIVAKSITFCQNDGIFGDARGLAESFQQVCPC